MTSKRLAIFKYLLLFFAILFIFISPVFATDEATELPLVIKGNRIFSFFSRSIEGSKEGFSSGSGREEALRLGIFGKVNGTKIEANFFSSSAIGGVSSSSVESVVSVSLANGPFYGYFGDFTPSLDGLELLGMQRVLSGLQFSADFDKYSFYSAISSPAGQPKSVRMYGNGSQGPYSLGASPVIPNSERLLLDGVLQKRGENYDVDYTGGSVTFKNKIIQTTSIIEVFYDYRGTVYQHSSKIFRAKILNKSIGVTYIDDSDTLADATTIVLTASSEPKSHTLIASDGDFQFGNTRGKYEAGYSEIKRYLLSDPNSKEGDTAYKLQLSSDFGPLFLSAKIKSIGKLFEAPGDPNPQKDLSEGIYSLSFRPLSFFAVEGNEKNSRYNQNGLQYLTSAQNARLSFFDFLSYNFDQVQESSDPVSGGAIDRLTIKNFGGLSKDFGNIRFTARGGRDKKESRSPSFEVIYEDLLSSGVSFFLPNYMNGATNFEIKRKKGNILSEYFTKSYNLTATSVSRGENLLSSSLTYVDDGLLGVSQTGDFYLKFGDFYGVKGSGKMTVASLFETFGQTKEATRKEDLSLSFDYSPIKKMKLRYYYKPSFSLLTRPDSIAIMKRVNQFDISYMLLDQLVAGYSFQLSENAFADLTDYPTYKRRKSYGDSGLFIYSIKAAPLKFLSCEFDLSKQEGRDFSLTSTSETISYSKLNSYTDSISSVIKTSVSEKISVDFKYLYTNSKSGSGESKDDQSNLKIHSATLKLIFNPTQLLSFNSYCTYSISKDERASSSLTYTLQPGGGVTFSPSEKIRGDLSLAYSKSYNGSSSEKLTSRFNGTFDLSQYVRILILATIENSKSPDYRTTDISGSVEINI